MNPKAESPAEDSYTSIAEACTEIYRIKGSRFMAFAWPVSSEGEIKAQLEVLRKEYFDATHHCYAWCLGKDRLKNRSNDDGEPSGTAGKPIYGQILSAGFSDVLMVVVRYFGGTKLGASGLIDAYKLAARQCLEKANPRTVILQDTFLFNFPYSRMNEVMKLLKEMELPVLEPDFAMECRLRTRVRRSQTESFIASAGKIDELNIAELSSTVD